MGLIAQNQFWDPNKDPLWVKILAQDDSILGSPLGGTNCRTCVMMVFWGSHFGARFGVRSISTWRVFFARVLAKCIFFANLDMDGRVHLETENGVHFL